MKYKLNVLYILVVTMSTIAVWAKEPDTRQVLLYDYPVVECDDINLLYQNLPKLRFRFQSYTDTISAVIKRLPPLKEDESYELRYKVSSDGIQNQLVLSRGPNAYTKKFLEKYYLRFGYLEICGYKVPVRISYHQWPYLRDLLYETLEKTEQMSTINIVKDYDHGYFLYSNEYYIFELKDNHSKIVFKGQQIEQ